MSSSSPTPSFPGRRPHRPHLDGTAVLESQRMSELSIPVLEIAALVVFGRSRGSLPPSSWPGERRGFASSTPMPSPNLLISGRKKLPGPLAHYGLSRSGKVFVVAAGTANHAGPGGWQGMASNCAVVGIEAENTGKDPWPQKQLDAYVALVAAICEHLKIPTKMVAAHREWAPTRKPDPHSLDMDKFREWVDEARSGGASKPEAPPQQKATINFEIGRVMVSQQKNDFHPDVRRAQGLLTAYSPVKPGGVDGVAGPSFDKSVRSFQQQKGLPETGEVDEPTWRALEGAD